MNRQNPTLSSNPKLPKRFTQLDALLDYLNLDRHSLPDPAPLIKNFALLVPLSFAMRMEKGNPHDPLLRQVLPQSLELASIQSPIWRQQSYPASCTNTVRVYYWLPPAPAPFTAVIVFGKTTPIPIPTSNRVIGNKHWNTYETAPAYGR